MESKISFHEIAYNISKLHQVRLAVLFYDTSFSIKFWFYHPGDPDHSVTLDLLHWVSSPRLRSNIIFRGFRVLTLLVEIG